MVEEEKDKFDAKMKIISFTTRWHGITERALDAHTTLNILAVTGQIVSNNKFFNSNLLYLLSCSNIDAL